MVLGNTTQATSCVLAEFLLGLAIGAAIGGRYIDTITELPGNQRAKPHLIIYGLLEIAIGLSALVCTWTLVAMPDVSANIYLHSPLPESMILVVQVLITFLLLLLPTIFMGATLPVLTCMLRQNTSTKPLAFALLYGINTCGAGFGVLFACFYGFGLLGIQGTVLLACVLNLACGNLAFVLFRGSDQENVCVKASVNQAQALVASLAASVKSSLSEILANGIAWPKQKDLQILYLLSFTSGFVALSYEVIWARLLRPLTSSSTYAISFMLATFLIALALASLIWTLWLRKDKSELTIERLVFFFALAQSAGALSFIVSYLLMPLAFRYREVLSSYKGAASLQLDKLLLAEATTCFAFIFLPTLLIGLCFPMVGTYAQKLPKTGHAVGAVYALNTIGSIIGALATGFLLIGFLGGTGALKITTLIAIVSVAFACLFTCGIKKTLLIGVSLPLALLFVVVCPQAYVVEQMANQVNARLIQVFEDSTGTAWVFDYPAFRMLLLNGESYSADVPWARRYMRFMGHVPILLCDKPDEALLIGFGAGITGGAMIQDERVRHVDVAELSKAVCAASQYFTDANQDVLLSGKLTTKFTDGRNLLLRSPKSYNVIVVSPPLPNDAQVVNLYTKEFYQLASNRLAQGGIFCQWVPMEHESEQLWKMAVKAACTQFAHVTIWMPVKHEAILIASNSPISLDQNLIASRLSQSKFALKSLASVNLPDAQAILQTFLVGGKKLNDYLNGVEPLSDEKPALEFFLPYIGRPMEPELIK